MDYWEGPLHTSFKLTPLLRTSSMSLKVELFASTLRDSLWLHSRKPVREPMIQVAVTGSIRAQEAESEHLASIWADRMHASRTSTAVPSDASSAISRKRVSRFSSFKVFESANDLQMAAHGHRRAARRAGPHDPFQ